MTTGPYRFPQYYFPGLPISEEFGEVDHFEARSFEDPERPYDGFTEVRCVIVATVKQRWLESLRKRMRGLGYVIRGARKSGKGRVQVHFSASLYLPID